MKKWDEYLEQEDEEKALKGNKEERKAAQ